jgi:DNA-binding NarL/FixJ family response regulator
MQTRLLLADDNFATRSALGLVLAKRLEMSVVGEAASLAELSNLAGAIQPDLLILDWELPGFRGVDSLKALRELVPGMKVVALSARPEAREAALAAGVDAFISMVEQPEVFFQAVRHCCQNIREKAENQPKG